MKGCFAPLLLLLVFVIVLQPDQAKGQIGAAKIEPTYDQLMKVWDIAWQHREKNPEFGPQLMRMAFHHCIGGCNGCVDMTVEDNKGLEGVIKELEALHQLDEIYPFFSMADLISYLTLPFMYSGIFKANRNCKWRKACGVPTPEEELFEFFWGREDGCNQINSTKQVPNGMPSIMLSTDELFDWFQKEFGMDKRGTLVLLGGGHSMGRAHMKNSNFNGSFTRQGNYGLGFSNQPFKRLIFPKEGELRFKPNFPSSPENKFFQGDFYGRRGGFNGLMLNSEYVAVYNTTLDPLKEPDCKLSDTVYVRDGQDDLKKRLKKKKAGQKLCTRSSAWFEAYINARSSQYFINSYFKALQKMMGHVPHQKTPLKRIMRGLPTSRRISRKSFVRPIKLSDAKFVESKNKLFTMGNDEAEKLIKQHDAGVNVPIVLQ